MITILQTLFVLAFLILLILFVLRPGKSKREIIPLPDHYKQLLADHVMFYRRLDEEGKKNFEKKIEQFLFDVRITGVNTTVEDIDRVFIGASAIIRIYAFPGWEYINLHEVLLYPDAFSFEFEQSGQHRSVTGMVGYGALQNVMLLSKEALRQGFFDSNSRSNTAIHEFAHLIDKTDGSIDGVPEVLLRNKYIMPWINMVRENMQAMMKGESDIDVYGVSNPAEFFAVVSEYFFERPDLLEAKHPELYAMLEQMFLRKENGSK